VSICVVFNPTARGDRARRLRQRLGQLADACVFKPTTGPGTARALAAAAVDEGHALIVAAGGDGTVNEVLNGLGDAANGFDRCILGVLPLGTANVFARELGIPFDLDRCWAMLRQGRARRVDLVRVECVRQGQPTSRWMIQLGGAGLDARAIEFVSWSLKKQAGVLAYVVAGLRALLEPQPRITLTADEVDTVGELVVLGNGRFYGGPFALFPEADLSDGALDARVIRRAGWKTALACGWGAITGRFGRTLGSEDRRASRLRLTSSSRVPLQIDGELVGELPASFEVVPRGLQVAVP
jgi:YegS/Rv2252/BmrU family lipid kinase